MKYSIAASFFTALIATVSASPLDVNAITRRAATDACNLGYCTQNGGTTGGASGKTVTVKTLADLTTAAASKDASTIIVSGAIKGAAQVRVGSNKTIYGEKGSSLTGVGFYVKGQKNVILRNLKIEKVLAKNGDAIGIQKSTNVWVDHCDLSGDLSAGKDTYDGLLDVTHAADFVTISNTKFHNHHKGSLVGHSDSNGSEDKGKLRVTYANNYWKDVGSRAPSLRFANVHIINNLEENVSLTGVNTRMGTQVFVQSSAWKSSTKKAILSVDSKETGSATTEDVDLGGGENTAPKGTLSASSFPYSAIKALGSKNLSSVASSAGQTL